VLRMSDETTSSYCRECKGTLTEIDNRGQLLRGCMTCNISSTTKPFEDFPKDSPLRTPSHHAPRLWLRGKQWLGALF
jgi:hypothetical protein